MRFIESVRQRVSAPVWQRAWDSGRAPGLREGWSETVQFLDGQAGDDLNPADAVALRSG